MVYEVKQDEITQEQWEEMKKITQENVCGVCGAELQIHTNPEKATIEVGCLNREHHGWVERETYTQAMRRGEEIHPAIRATIERKMMPRDELGRAMNLLALRYPKAIVDPPTAALFILDCTRLDLDPLISPAEAVPVPFKSRRKVREAWEEKVTVTMVITEDGWLSMAARGCPDRWAGAPSVERVDDKALAGSLCSDPDAWVWKATGRTKDMELGQTSSAYGYYTHKEHGKAEEHTPAATQPGNQARVRAIKRWVRENFPECRQRMMDITAEWVDRAEGVKAAKEFIDAEYAFISLPEGKVGAQAQAKKTETPPAAKENPLEESIEGEGFSINLTWLKESQKVLKWSDETMLSFLAGEPYKVSGKSVTEALGKLAREQAEDFVKEINSRLEKQTSLF